MKNIKHVLDKTQTETPPNSLVGMVDDPEFAQDNIDTARETI